MTFLPSRTPIPASTPTADAVQDAPPRRRTRSRRRALTAGAVVLTLLLSACGSSGTTDTSPVDATTAPSHASVTEDDAAPADLTPPAALEGPSTAATIEEIVPLEDPDQPQLPAAVTDHTGATVTIEKADRILALDLYGTFSDIITGLGLGDRLVGRTSSDTSEAMADLPLVTTGGHDLNIEAILALQPTLVFADSTLGPPEIYDQLRSAGVTLVMLDPDRSIDTNESMISQVAAALGVEDTGTRLIERYQDELEQARQHIEALAPQDPAEQISAAILYVRGTAGIFFVLGSESGAEDVVEGIGAVDAAADAGIQGTRPANAEALAALDPDVILVMSEGLESTGGLTGLLERPGVAQTTAGQSQRIIDVPDGQLLSYGPQTPQALVSLADAVYQPDTAP